MNKTIDNISEWDCDSTDIRSKLQKIKFTETRPGCDRRHYVTPQDIKIVLSRLPIEVWGRLRAVHFNDKSRGVRILGYVTRGYREIAMCALPPRVSLTRFLEKGQSPRQFGAQRGCQWPLVAIRRYLLYDAFLHELGHLQLVDEKARSLRRKFAGESIAQAFADYWRTILWREDCSYDDPAHMPPDPKELLEIGNHRGANVDKE